MRLSLKTIPLLLFLSLASANVYSDEYERETCNKLYIFDPKAGEVCHKDLDATIGISDKEAKRRKQLQQFSEKAKTERIANCGKPNESIRCWAEIYELQKPHILNKCSALIEIRNRREFIWSNPEEMRFPFNLPRKLFKNGKNYPESMNIFGLHGSQMKSKNPLGKWVSTNYVCWLDQDTDQILDVHVWYKK